MKAIKRCTRVLQSLRRAAAPPGLRLGLPVLTVVLGVLAMAPGAQAAPSLSTGGSHTCAVGRSGAARCWGLNEFGQLGDGTTTNSNIPVAVAGLSAGVRTIAADWTHTCALTTEGGVLCWGQNGEGQLGDGTTTNRSTPVAVSGLTSGATAIAAGDFHSCAVTTAGETLCWGFNQSGQLGDGTTTNSNVPVHVSGLSSGVIAITAGVLHTCALTTAGEALCWGWNGSGQLGDGTTTMRTTPVAVSGLSSGVIAIAAGGEQTCALTSGGGVLCWGQNNHGQLGDGTTTSSSVPVHVSGLSSGVIAIAAGGEQTCALTQVGGVLCWGQNEAGQLGDGTTTMRTTPVAVSGLSSGVIAIATGEAQSCALAGATEVVTCWGSNEFGQLGDGTTTNSTTPVEIVRAGQTITIPTQGGRTVGEADFEPGGASASSGLTVTYASRTPTICTIVSNKVHLVGAGECTIVAEQAGNIQYVPAEPVERSFSVVRGIQTIAFPAQGGRTLGEADFGPGASASSGLTVTYASRTPTICTIVSNKVHLVGAGECTVLAEQAGDNGYNGAEPVERSFSVVRAGQSITFPAQGGRTVGDADFGPGASASSGLAVTYVSKTPAVCTIISDNVHLVGAGECTIVAEQGGNSEYAAAQPVERSFSVAAAKEAGPSTPGGPGTPAGPTSPAGPAPKVSVPAPKVKLSRAGRGKSLRYVLHISDATKGATFSCRLDKGKFVRCGSKKVYRHLSRNRVHVFRVKAVSPTGTDSKVRVLHVGKVPAKSKR
jgi:alpha-tubulin suppressor-like RCC1 family protein